MLNRHLRAGVAGLLLTLLATPASAADEARLELAVRLLAAMQTQKSMEDQLAMMRHAQVGMVAQMITGMGMKAEDVKKMEPIQEEVSALTERELSWDTMKGDYAAVYASTFTEEELKGLIAFYESPIGEALITKTPDMTAKLMEITQRRMATLMPKIQELLKQGVSEGSK